MAAAAQCLSFPATSPNRRTAMALPLTDQFRHEQWRRLIQSAGPGDLENLRQLASCLLDYAVSHRGLAMQLLEPMAKPPAAEATGGCPSLSDQ